MPESATSPLASPTLLNLPLGGARTRSEKLLRECRSITALRLLKTLPDIMDRVDDALFELAEQSDNNTQQSYYFDAMRKLRIERAGIEARFTQQLDEDIERTPDASGTGASQADAWDLSSTNLGLVDNDDLEISLAVTNLVAKIKSASKEELFALDKRIGWLLKDPDLEEHDNPISPASICNAYKDACKDLDTDVEIKLLLLKLFDNHVIDEVAGVYAEVNRYLVQHHIVTHIKSEIKRSPNRESTSTQVVPVNDTQTSTTAPMQFMGEAGPMSSAGLAQSTSSGWRSGTLATQTSDVAPMPVGAAGQMPAQALFDTVQQVMRLNAVETTPLTSASGQVLSNLTALQSGDAGAMTCVESGIAPEQLHAGTSNVLHQLKSTNVAQGMNQVDDMMIDVVAMMFDYILDDKNIPAAMKALIGRLQIPLLKVAILDKAFFARKFHHARKLLNQMAEVALGWSETSDTAEALHQKLESIVQRVLNEFRDDVTIFSEVLADLESFLDSEERAAQENAALSTQLIEGRERLARAKSVVEQTLTKRTESCRFKFLTDFLGTHWGNLLTTAYVKDGEDSPAWSNAIDLMDDLLWSIAPKPIHEDKVRLVSLLPGLLKRVKEGMARIGLPDEQRERFLKKLAKIHLAAIRTNGASANEAKIEHPRSTSTRIEIEAEGSTLETEELAVSPLSTDSSDDD